MRPNASNLQTTSISTADVGDVPGVTSGWLVDEDGLRCFRRWPSRKSWVLYSLCPPIWRLYLYNMWIKCVNMYICIRYIYSIYAFSSYDELAIFTYPFEVLTGQNCGGHEWKDLEMLVSSNFWKCPGEYNDDTLDSWQYVCKGHLLGISLLNDCCDEVILSLCVQHPNCKVTTLPLLGHHFIVTIVTQWSSKPKK